MVLTVAPNGNDAWSGTRATPNRARTDGPLATLEGARDAIRKLKQAGGLPAGGVTVEVRGGTYELARPLALTAEDAGTPEAPITYQARPGEEVRLVGGKMLRGWQPVTDAAVLARLDPAARDHVVQTDLKAQGVTDFGEMGGGFAKSGGPGLELFFADRPMTLARYPNEGFIKITGVEGATEVDVRGTKGRAEGVFTYEGDRPRRWVAEKDPWVLGYWFWDWAEGRQSVQSIEPDAHRMTLREPHHGYGYRVGQWFYGYNLLCEIDQPGEWYLDRESGILYLWPPDSPEKHRAMVSVLPTLITLDGASHVTLRGLTLEGCRGTAVQANGCVGTRIAGCTVRNVGSWAVSVNGGEGVQVVGCDIYATGDGGISLSGGDRTTLTPARHLAENNHIHHYSRWNRMYRPALMLSGVGLQARHNLIHNAPHMAIGFGGNDHVIELNEIHSVCYESNDAGAIYAGRDWTMRGTVIRHNYLHHINGHEGRGCVGVYLDDMYCGTEIVGNVFYRVTRAAFIGGGRDCTIANNIFVECDPAVHVDARALGWAHDHSDMWIEEAKTKGTLSGIAYNKPPYSTRYPQLVPILDEDPAAPRGNTIARNIRVGGTWDSIEGKARPLLKLENNFLEGDPRFVNAGRLDFRLRPDSPVWKLGFQPIPIEKIGLYRDPERASWPVRHTVRPMVTPPPPAPRAARPGPPPVLRVSRSTAPPVIDGEIGAAEWGGPEAATLIAQGVQGEPAAPTSLAWLRHDGTSLYVAIENRVDPAKPLGLGNDWGSNDAVELALRAPAGRARGARASGRSSQDQGDRDATSPILVLRGFASGHFESSEEAGAPAAAVARAAQGVRYRAKVVGPDRWVCEWRIPFASLGVNPNRQSRLAFNLSVRKTANDLWLMWQGTGSYTWEVAHAGFLELAR